ncbi:MAG: inositol monophosphatase family protein [Desulfarculaceae bacterium]|jgi:myo-inositol-1(or 4)-monophosphatase
MIRAWLDTALEAAKAGTSVLKKLWGHSLTVQSKSRFDFVTDADQKSEAAILEVIRRRHPDHLILAEESSQDFKKARGTEKALWIVDPLDGTTNFIHGFPHVAVSVAVAVNGQPLAGVVVDVFRDEVFYASKGQGAWLGNTRLQVSQAADPAQALLLTGFPFRQKHRLQDFLGLFTELFEQVSGIRRAGAAALDLAYVAAGRAEGFWEIGLNPWDVAAGAILITEAGGVIDDFSGKGGHLWDNEVVAGNPVLVPWLKEACSRHLGK